MEYHKVEAYFSLHWEVATYRSKERRSIRRLGPIRLARVPSQPFINCL